MKFCTVNNCGAKHYGKGLCRLHYRRQHEGKHGMDVPPCRMCQGKIVGRKIEAEFCSNACKMKWERRFGCYYKPPQPKVYRGPRVATVCTECGKPTGKGAAKDLCLACYTRRYYALNQTVERARRNARRTRMVTATPIWADLRAIHQFYIRCPRGHEVDHIIPLKGRRVSGLHVGANLQYLPMGANRRKSNTYSEGI